MAQFIGIMIVFGIVAIYNKVNDAKAKRYLEAQYNKASITGDREAAIWYSERLSHYK